MRIEYALLAYFDTETELWIKRLWNEMNELGITDYGTVLDDRRPHLTIADYQTLHVEKIMPLLNDYFDNQVSVPLSFNALGSFIGANMLYLAPTMTKQLFHFHTNYHEAFQIFNQNPQSYYLPEHWVPHCTIAGRLSDETFPQALSFCKKQIPVIQTSLVEIGLLEVVFDEDGNIVEDKMIFSKKFS